eukprot:gene9942-7813_t
MTLIFVQGQGGLSKSPGQDGALSKIPDQGGPLSNNPGQGGALSKGVQPYQACIAISKEIMLARTLDCVRVLMEKKGSDFNHVNVSAAICRLPKLYHHTEDLKAILLLLAKPMQHNLTDFSSRHWGDMLWGLSKVKDQAGLEAGALLDMITFQLSQGAKEEFEGCQIRSLAISFYALAIMGRTKDGVLPQIAEMLVDVRDELNCQDISNTLWALASCDLKDLCPRLVTVMVEEAEEHSGRNFRDYSGRPHSETSKDYAVMSQDA